MRILCHMMRMIPISILVGLFSPVGTVIGRRFGGASNLEAVDVEALKFE